MSLCIWKRRMSTTSNSSQSILKRAVPRLCWRQWPGNFKSKEGKEKGKWRKKESFFWRSLKKRWTYFARFLRRCSNCEALIACGLRVTRQREGCSSELRHTSTAWDRKMWSEICMKIENSANCNSKSVRGVKKGQTSGFPSSVGNSMSEIRAVF